MTAPQPAPAAADARGVVVDAAALEALRYLVPVIEPSAAAAELRALISTARPLPTAAGAVDLSALGEIRAVADTLSVCGSGTGATKMRQMATALRAACDALAADLDAAIARAERAEAALRDDVAAQYRAAFAADAAARARLAAERAAIAPTERDRREASGEHDPWAPWREGAGRS